MPELLIEIFSEEIPARMQRQAEEDLKLLFIKTIEKYGIPAAGVKTYITPQRLILTSEELAEEKPAKREEYRGPKIGAAPVALEGFSRSIGVSLDQCYQRDGYWWAQKETLAQKTILLLPDILEDIFKAFPWPKTMRWPGSSLLWVRPIRHILCIFDGEAHYLPLPSLGLSTQNLTYGHRFLSPGSIEVHSFQAYQTELRRANVLIDRKERQESIRHQLLALAQKHDLQWIEDESLLEEVTGLVEYPVVLLGRIDPVCMQIPEAILKTAMRVHQRYFAFRTFQGSMAPYFGVVANTQTSTQHMIQGYERVLRARLNDAQFFWQQDVHTPLESLIPGLHQVIFHAKLGTLAQKIVRLHELVLSPEAKRAALLCKSDLLTHVVKEFPELQGIMGEIYALYQGEHPETAAAIRAHYQPQGPMDTCPHAPVSVELALAEKIDTLIGFFGINEGPTGSRDPYALRRAALGVIRLIRENNAIDLRGLLERAAIFYTEQGISLPNPNCVEEVYAFLVERLAVLLKSEGIRHDCIQAVIDSELGAIAEKAQALNTFLQTPQGQDLLSAARRVLHILNTPMPGEVQVNLFCQPEEHQLLTVIHTTEGILPPLLSAHTYNDALETLSQISATVNTFFDNVIVNTEDPNLHQNRVALLQELADLFGELADFRKLEG